MKRNFIAAMTLRCGCDKEVFNAWLERVLLPQLGRGTTVIMDNATFHKTPKTKELIESAGCHLLYQQHGQHCKKQFRVQKGNSSRTTASKEGR